MRPLRLLPLLALVAPGVAHAATQDLDALERRLVIALGADIGQPGGPRAPIDRRMKLAACPADVTIEPPALGAATLRCAAVGWRVRVPLLAGGTAAVPAARTASAPPARSAPVIRRGDPVELSADARGFIVTSEVVAEQDGAPGERIRVRGEGRTPMMVEVIEPGRARLPGYPGL